MFLGLSDVAAHCVCSIRPSATTTLGLHPVMDNSAAHNRAEVRDQLAANPRIIAHLTPASG